MAVSERRWKAESDVRTLAEAEAIKQNLSRLNSAKKAAKHMVEEEQKKVNEMKKVANVALKKTVSKKKK